MASLTERINIQTDVSAAMEKECEALRSAVGAGMRRTWAVCVLDSAIHMAHVPKHRGLGNCNQRISKKYVFSRHLLSCFMLGT